MDYGSMASVASSMIGNYYAGKASKIQAGTANYIRGQNNKVVAAENARDAEITGLQRWRQSVYNKRVYEKIANDREVSEVNFNRQADARKRTSFAAQVQYAEEQGRLAASAAASGVSGNVVDMLNAASQMRKSFQNVQLAETERQFGYDHARQLSATHWANMDQMDYSLIFDNPRGLDYGRDIANGPSLLSGINTKDLKAAVQGFDFSFSKPKAEQVAAIDPWAGTDHVN